MRRIFYICLLALTLTACGEYQKAQKSSDYNYKFDYAKRAFENKQYMQAITLLNDCLAVFKGTDKAEESLYLMGMSHYENKDYVSAAEYFKQYYTRFPKGKYAEPARFLSGFAQYKESPDVQLDQTATIAAIQELQGFLEFFPNSNNVQTAQDAIFELQDKLTLKELQNAQLYYNLGNYMGNNYQSAVIVARNAVRTYPYSKYKEDLELLILKAKYQEAVQSVDERKAERFRDVVDEYYGFIGNYPDSPHLTEAKNIFKVASKYVKE